MKEQEAGVSVADLCRKHGTSDATVFMGKAKYGGMYIIEAKRLKRLGYEDARLKRLLAEAILDHAAFNGLMGKMVAPAERRQEMAHLAKGYGMSERWAVNGYRQYEGVSGC